jgi:hypothetical protein
MMMIIIIVLKVMIGGVIIKIDELGFLLLCSSKRH